MKPSPSVPDKLEVSRKDLYDQVWSTPMSRLAERYDVSGSYLARVCEALNVPRPPVGYWQKKAVGKAGPQPVLPQARPGDQLVWSKRKPIARPAKKPKTRNIRRAENADKRKIGRHPILVGVERYFLKTRKMEQGEFLRPYKKLLPDVITSESCLKYAIQLANDIYKGLEEQGHRVLFAAPDQNMRRVDIEEREKPSGDRKYGRYSMGSIWSPHRPTVTFVGSVPFGLSLTEMTERSTMRYVGGNFVREDSKPVRSLSPRQLANTWTTEQDLPCGRFKLTVYSPVQRVKWVESWQESRKVSLSSMIKTIIRTLERSSGQVNEMMVKAEEEAVQRQKDWEESQERWRRDEDRRLVQKARSESHKQLSEIMDSWKSAMSTELFFQEAEKRIERLDDERKHVLMRRVELARSMSGTIDPLDFLQKWRSPQELYEPKFDQDQNQDYD